MSVSPQSLARTRDKRVPKIPARFDDFSEIPSEVICRNAIAEALTRSKSRSSKRHCDENRNENRNYIGNQLNSPFHPSVTFSTNAPMKQSQSFKGTRRIVLPPSAFVDTSESPPHASEDESKSASPNLDGQPQQPPPTPSPPTHPTEESKSSSSKLENQLPPPPPSPAVAVAAAAAVVVQPPRPKPLANDKSKSSSLSKKKTKGLSLIKTNESLQVQSNGNLVNPNPQQPPPTQVPQNAKLFGSLPHNMKYGTRLMLNEPIYLPRSVATIAPITRTYQQMANQLRKPPFLSEKAEACLSYQEERKLNYILSTHSALARITKYLSTKDLVNLRAVNTTWKSIVDSDALWKRVVFESGLRIDWQLLFLSVINRFNSTELVLNNYTGKAENSSESTLALAAATVSHAKILTQLLLPWDGHPRNKSLEHVRIRSTGPEQNSFAFALILFLFFHQTRQNQREKMLEVTWQVRILIDPDGWGKFPIIPEYAKRVEKLITPDFFRQHFSKVYLKDLPASIDNDEKSTGHLMIDFSELKEVVESERKNKASFRLKAI